METTRLEQTISALSRQLDVKEQQLFQAEEEISMLAQENERLRMKLAQQEDRSFHEREELEDEIRKLKRNLAESSNATVPFGMRRPGGAVRTKAAKSPRPPEVSVGSTSRCSVSSSSSGLGTPAGLTAYSDLSESPSPPTTRCSERATVAARAASEAASRAAAERTAAAAERAAAAIDRAAAEQAAAAAQQAAAAAAASSGEPAPRPSHSTQNRFSPRLRHPSARESGCGLACSR